MFKKIIEMKEWEERTSSSWKWFWVFELGSIWWENNLGRLPIYSRFSQTSTSNEISHLPESKEMAKKIQGIKKKKKSIISLAINNTE